MTKYVPLEEIERELADLDHRTLAPKPPDDTRVIHGVERRVVTLAALNERFAILETHGSASIYVSRGDFQPIQDADLKRRLAPEVVITGYKDRSIPIYKSAFTVWTGNAQRHVYRRIDFTSRPLPGDTYNLFRGLGVTPKQGKCSLILKHIEEVLCSADKDAASAMVKLMAWQIQNIGKPSRTVVVLKSRKHQAGKGVILGEVLAKIYGPSGFTPSSIDRFWGGSTMPFAAAPTPSLTRSCSLATARQPTPSRASQLAPRWVSKRKACPSSNVPSRSTCGWPATMTTPPTSMSTTLDIGS
jgi:hypothetical protein